MILSKKNLSGIASGSVTLPLLSSFALPEKVLQFGTGVLLRGLPDDFIQNANQQGVFNGRVVVVKSTGNSTADFDEQDSLYTLCVRGLEEGREVHENRVSSAISRVLAAERDWKLLLEVAASETLELVVSNTTEVGIVYMEERIGPESPLSFPAKLLSLLHHRFDTFSGDLSKGLVVIATELIPDNGKKLEAIVRQLATFNELSPAFFNWLAEANVFCNSLVDRIVPGKPSGEAWDIISKELGYDDQLMLMAEPYRLWAIEGGEEVKKVLSFAQVDPGVIIAEDIEIYRELKVRLLNGTHTLTTAIAFFSGISTVSEGMKQEFLKDFVEDMMQKEIGPSIPYPVDATHWRVFANHVKDRFANPFIAHLWTNIAFQYSMKMKIRVLPLLRTYFQRYGKVPFHMALGFAAFLKFMRIQRKEGTQFFGEWNETPYIVTDDHATYFYENYQQHGDNFSKIVMEDEAFWGESLNAFPGFVDKVVELGKEIDTYGMVAVLKKNREKELNEV